MSEPKPVAWMVEEGQRPAFIVWDATGWLNRDGIRVTPLYPGPFRFEFTHSACASSVDGLRTRYRRLVSEWEHDPSNP